MVKRNLLIVLSLLLLCVVALLAGGWWLLASPQGQRRLVAELSRRAAVTIEADLVEGRLLDHLRLGGVTLTWTGGEARFATVELRWQPAALLRGQLAIAEMSLADGRIAWSHPPPEAPTHGAEFAWPRLDGWLLRLRASIAELRLANLELQPPAGESQHLERLTARLEWRGGVLSVEQLDAAMAGFRLRGDAAAGFRQPQLRLALQLGLPTATAGIDNVVLHADLAPATGAIMTGPLTLQGHSGAEPTLQLTGDLAVRSDALALPRFELTQNGRRGALNGSAEVSLAEGAAHWHLQGSLVELDLEKETGMTTALEGRLEMAGRDGAYRGNFDLLNRAPDWSAMRLGGPFAGDATGVDLPQLEGTWLGGALDGALRLAWDDGINLSGTLRGRQLDPAGITPTWSGSVNFDLAGDYSRPGSGPQRARLQGRLLDSTLRGLALSGRVDAELTGDDLRIVALELHGDGFDLSSHGRLAERLELRATVARLSGLVPAAQGTLTAAGWLRWCDGALTGAIDGHGRQLAYDDLRANALQLAARLSGGPQPIAIDLTGTGLAYRDWQLQQLDLQFAGSVTDHDLELQARWPGGAMQAAAAGGWRDGAWTGTVKRLDGRDSATGPWRLLGPVGLAAETNRIRLATLRLAGADGENLQLDGSLAWQPWQGDVQAQWQGLVLARFNPWLTGTQLTGRSDGSVSLQWRADGHLDLAGRVEAAGQAKHNGLQLDVHAAASEFAWNADGLRANLKAELEQGGRLTLHLSSAQPGRLALPDQGRFAAEWSGFDLALLQPWLPIGFDLAGALRGKADGSWQPGWQLEMAGAANIDAGRLGWQAEAGEVRADLRMAHLDWVWRDQQLSGELALALAEHGEARGSFRLPLPAQLPAVLKPDGPLHLALMAKVSERGLLTTFFPGLVEASRGELEVQAQARGTWENPDLGGSVHLTGAGAYFPAAGIELKEVALDGELAGDEIRIVSIRARSGDGQVSGSGSIRLENWWPVAYRGAFSGERFEAVHLPELQLLLSPDLTVEGTAESLQVRGEIRVPELTLLGREQRELVRESADVIIVGAEAQAEPSFPMALDMRVQIKLGDRVLVKVAGVDARLSGGGELQFSDPGKITANGEIQVAQGIYSTYGVQLKIERGRLLYSGGPVDQPTFDIQALRTIGTVKAGVQITGTPRVPVIKLYSEPAMSDTDVLAYIVLGHPVGAETGQLSLLSVAAGAILSRSQSVLLQDKIRRQLGIDVIDVEESGDATGSMVTIGKYLNPKLYLSLGQALFTNASEARLRYSITPQWELESRTTGETSGIDLYYKLEFE